MTQSGVLEALRDAKENFKKAVKAFKKVNHVRGCFLAYQHLTKLKQMSIEIQKDISKNEEEIGGHKKLNSLGSLDILGDEDEDDYDEICRNFAHLCEL